MAMRDAMLGAEVGDDVYGEDPTVNRLEAESAARLGKEAALFATSGTQANLLALLSHCQRGDEYITGDSAHNFLYEGGGGAALGGVQPHVLPVQPDGTLDLQQVEQTIKPDDYHFARTRLFCLENTIGGKVLPLAYLKEACSFAHSKGLATHLDGARIFNAAIALDCPAQDIAEHFDTVSFCLSKGLGAPAGSLLTGTKSLINRARRWRKLLGGGMRQSGILAAAGLYALDHQVERLAEDHRRAALLASGLANISTLSGKVVQATNMIFLDLEPNFFQSLSAKLIDDGVQCGDFPRLVCHLDIDDQAIEHAIAAFNKLLT